jgi:hypothetical protein
MRKFDIGDLASRPTILLTICTWTRIQIRKGGDKLLTGSVARSPKCSSRPLPHYAIRSLA